KNAFAPIIGFARTHLCGVATAQNVNGVVGPTGSDPPTADCIGEDNFADATDKPTIFPATGQCVKADTQIGANFKGGDLNLDLDQDHPEGPDCGNASWSFTWDGQGAIPGSACGENSFIASVYPPGGTAAPGEHIGAIYSDESPLQDTPWSPAFPFGVKFTLSGPGWTDADGNPTFV